MRGVLVVGNYLNIGSYRGFVFGFRFDMFFWLKDFKVVDRKIFLLYFVYKELVKIEFGIGNFFIDFVVVKKAAVFLIETIFANLGKL